MDTELTTEDLEALFVNNGDLERLGAYLNRFNPIRVMKMEGMEIRHSSILSWLMDPRETHGLGDRFLKAFLSEALRGQGGSPSALDIVQADLRDVEIRREWQHIDIFVFSPLKKWAFVIENKYYSRQHKGQLSKYAEKVMAIYPGMTVRGIFLTLWDEEPHDPAYAPINYEAVAGLLSPLIAQAGQTLGAEVTTFLRHYIEIIEEETGMSQQQNDAEQLARDLYRQHKKVLDFIMDHGAGTDFNFAAEALCGENRHAGDRFSVGSNAYVYSGINHYQWSFLPETWVNALGGWETEWPGCEKWWAGLPLICRFELVEAKDMKGKLRLIAEVGPMSDQNSRNNLIETIKSVTENKEFKSIGFGVKATDTGTKYSRFFKKNSEEIDNTQDAKEISDKMTKLLTRFEPNFDAVSQALPKSGAYRIAASYRTASLENDKF
ncbi:PD-(D/E)XK nuclease family protein [Asticcacaulis sp. SL142]|uniref:PDDEXK-like family protein n=1 Tax=Asticcacaulis sp. SL142 TaxID=2995155 RepID=UPI00226D2DB6|nr:PD-(D/E)XK nuclease family protein [Asticcacaulis sp. SL142]WAC47229.1 PD-(D/E)XK nuclease family protein [Asticcacaulis sp. SL142]